MDAGEALAGVTLWRPGPGRYDDSAFVLIGPAADLAALAAT